jgi:hypothetical protein
MKAKNLVTSFLIGSLAVAGVAGTAQVSAHGFGGDKSAFTEKFSQRFNLNPDEVKTFFAEQHEARKAEMEKGQAERLDQAVADGKITEDQKNAIIQKHEEIKQRMEAIKELPEDERKDAVKALHEEMKTWSEANGIPMLKKGMGKGKMNHFKKFNR